MIGKKRADHELKLKSFWDTLGRPSDPEEVKQCHGGHLWRLHHFSFIKDCPLVFPKSPGFPFIRLSFICFSPAIPLSFLICFPNIFFLFFFFVPRLWFHILSSCKYAFFVYRSLQPKHVQPNLNFNRKRNLLDLASKKYYQHLHSVLYHKKNSKQLFSSILT